MGFELCYLPDMPATLRALAGAGNSIEKWWRQIEDAKKRPDGTFTAMNILAMAASYDPDPAEFLGMRLPVTFDTCEVIEERCPLADDKCEPLPHREPPGPYLERGG